MFTGGELLPAALLQPCAGAPSGRGHLFSGWVNLAPCIFSSNNVLLAVQAWGTPSAWCHVPRPLPSGGFHLVGGLYPSLASIFPAHYCPLHHLVSFLSAITLNCIKGNCNSPPSWNPFSSSLHIHVLYLPFLT